MNLYEFPLISSLLAGFNQDWDLDYASWQDGVRDWVAGAATVEVSLRLLDELDSVLASPADDTVLERFLRGGPEVFEYDWVVGDRSPRAWLEEVRAIVREERARRTNE